MQRIFSMFRRKNDSLKPMPTIISKTKKFILYGIFACFGLLVFARTHKSELIFSCDTNEENVKLLRKNAALKKSIYEPTLYFPFGFMQTIFAKYFQSAKYLRTEDQQIDGNTVKKVFLHHNISSEQKLQKCPLVVVFCGSQGFNNAVTSMMVTLYRRNFDVVGIDVKDFHNVGNMSNLVKKLKAQAKNRSLYGIGFQYGANLLVNYAGSNQNLFEGIVSIGNPLSLTEAEKNVGLSWLAKMTYYKDMVNGRLKHYKGDITEGITLYDVDRKLYNLSQQQLQKWKKEHSSLGKIKNLKVRTIFIQSQQDPFTISLLEKQELQNPYCIYIQTQKGGHCEWFQSSSCIRWVNEPTSSFLKNLEELKSEKV